MVIENIGVSNCSGTSGVEDIAMKKTKPARTCLVPTPPQNEVRYTRTTRRTRSSTRTKSEG